MITSGIEWRNVSNFLLLFLLILADLIILGIVGNKSKSKVVEFFFVNAMEEEAQEILPTSDSTYEKWLTGKRNPQCAIWAALAINFDFSKL